ncbi:hypothetical protein DENSPDRAFT_751733, partial [Dentipellis sp. KUC8613]
PHWMEEARTFLKTGPKSVEWDEVIAKWTACEELLGYPGAKERKHWLEKEKRPFAIGQWMKEGRHYEKVQPLGNLMIFADTMRCWWIVNQPGWRKISERGWPLKRMTNGDETWDQLQKGGPNGIFLFLVPLVWW